MDLRRLTMVLTRLQMVLPRLSMSCRLVSRRSDIRQRATKMDYFGEGL